MGETENRHPFSVANSPGPAAGLPGSGGEVIRRDLVIIGGGLVGLSLASALGSVGFRVAVIDRDDPADQQDEGFDGRVSALALASCRMLDALGLWAPLRPDAEPIRDIRVTDGEAPVVLHFDHRELGQGPLGHIVENRALRRVLSDRVPAMDGVDLFAPAMVEELAIGPDAVRIRLKDGRRLAAALVIGADGRASLVRRQAGIAQTRWAYGQTAIVTTVCHALPHEGVAEERFLPAGPFAILPLPDDEEGRHRSSLVWTEREDRAPGFLALEADDFDREIARRFGDHLGPVHALGPRWRYPLELSLAECFIGPRLALVGDAAHTIHPIAGQGLNLGLRDAAALAECLAEGMRLGLDPGDATMLHAYQRWRRFDTVALAATTDLLNRLFSNGCGPIAGLRDLGLALANRIGPARRGFMREAMGLGGDLPRLLRGEPLSSGEGGSQGSRLSPSRSSAFR